MIVCLCWGGGIGISASVCAAPLSLQDYGGGGVVEWKQDRSPVTDLKLFLEKTFPGDSQADLLELDRARDLLDYLSFLYSRLVFFQRNNEMVSAFIRNSVLDDDPVLESLERLLIDQKTALTYGDPGVWNTPQECTNLTDYYRALKSYESVLMNRLKKIQIISDQMRALKAEVLARPSSNTGGSPDSVAGLSSGTRRILQDNLGGKDQTIRQQQEQIIQLTQQFSQMQLGLDVFRDRLARTDEQIAGLTKEAAARSLDLYAKDQEAQKANQRFENLQTEFLETQERLRLVQRIIQEKDDHIQALEGEVLNLHSAVNTVTDVPPGDIGDLRTEMTSRIQRMQDDIHESQGKISRLEERFQDVSLVNAQLRFELHAQEVMIHDLASQTRQKDAMIADLEKGFHIKTQKVLEMRDIIAIYKDKLRDYARRLEQRDQQLQGLLQKEMSQGAGIGGEPVQPGSDRGAAITAISDYQDMNDLLWNIGEIENHSRRQLLELGELKEEYEN